MSTNPNTIKSQDDLPTCNSGKRSSEVVLSAVEKCELLQKQLDIALECIKYFENQSESRGDSRFAENYRKRIEKLNEIHKQELR